MLFFRRPRRPEPIVAATVRRPIEIPLGEPALIEPDNMPQLVPLLMDNDARTALATRCRDCDVVSKVNEAGQVVVEPDGRRVQVMHNGVRVIADGYGGPWMTRLIELCHGHHEAQEERVFHEVVSRLPPGGTMLELGGWWAFYSMWFLRGAPGRMAGLLEPDPAHIAVG